MIDFSLTEEQLALQQTAKEFAEKELKPNASKYDKGDEFPYDVMQKAFDVGFLSCTIPEEYGGGGLNEIDSTIVSEELAAGCAGMYCIIMVNALAYTPILLYGTEEQKKRFLTPQTEKMSFASFALTEREAGSDAAAQKTVAIQDGSEYVINGSKCFISNAPVADFIVIFAMTNPAKGTRGISAIVVPKDTPGLIIGKKEDKMGQRACPQTELIFEDMRVPVENRLGKEGMGFLIAMKTLERTRPPVGIGGVGVARAALEYAVEFTKTRKQFGKPVALFQANSFKIAQMAMEINAARHLAYHAAWLLEEGKPCGKESSMAKTFGSDVAMSTTIECIQLCGGYGYMRDYPLEKLARDAKLLQIYEGTNEIQRLVMAREVIGPIK